MRPVEHFRKTPAHCTMLNYSKYINDWIKVPQKQLDEMMEFMNYCYSTLTMYVLHVNIFRSI